MSRNAHLRNFCSEIDGCSAICYTRDLVSVENKMAGF